MPVFPLVCHVVEGFADSKALGFRIERHDDYGLRLSDARPSKKKEFRDQAAILSPSPNRSGI